MSSNTLDKNETPFSLNYFPNNQKYHIDYVIYYETTEKTSDEAKAMRGKFKNQLESKTFEVMEIQFNNNQKTFLLLHCPTLRLMEEAEKMKLEMPLKHVSIFTNRM